MAALLVLDPDVAPAWAREHGIEFSSPAELAANPEVLAEIERGVAEANSHLARPEQVRRYVVLADEWTALTGELTPSLKRRRPVITQKYAREIAGALRRVADRNGRSRRGGSARYRLGFNIMAP